VYHNFHFPDLSSAQKFLSRTTTKKPRTTRLEKQQQPQKPLTLNPKTHRSSPIQKSPHQLQTKSKPKKKKKKRRRNRERERRTRTRTREKRDVYVPDARPSLAEISQRKNNIKMLQKTGCRPATTLRVLLQINFPESEEMRVMKWKLADKKHGERRRDSSPSPSPHTRRRTCASSSFLSSGGRTALVTSNLLPLQ
jgi:hypothetical protein